MRSKSVGPALAVLFLVNVLNYYDRQTLAAILEPLRQEFSLSDTQLGGLFTLFTIVFAFAGLPLGKLADTRSRRGLLACGIAVWTGLTGLAGLATSYALLLATRLGNNAGTLGVASTNRLFVNWPRFGPLPERRAQLLEGPQRRAGGLHVRERGPILAGSMVGVVGGGFSAGALHVTARHSAKPVSL